MKTIRNHGHARIAAAALAAIVLAAVLASAGFAGLRGSLNGAAAAKQYPGKKVTLCHRTHSKKHPWVKIRVSSRALRAHLRHGDFVVDADHPCPPASASAKAKHGKGKHAKAKHAKAKHAKAKHAKAKHGKGKGKKAGAAAKKQHGNGGSGAKHGKK